MFKTKFPNILNTIKYMQKIEINGQKEFILSGCKKIAEYSEDNVVLQSYSMNVYITGSNLELVLLSNKTIAIKGLITNIKLENIL